MKNDLVSGGKFMIMFDVLFNEEVVANQLNIGLGIGTEDNIFVAGVHTNNISSNGGIFNENIKINCEVNFACLLLEGTYYLSCSVLSVIGKHKILLRKNVDCWMFKVRQSNTNRYLLIY